MKEKITIIVKVTDKRRNLGSRFDSYVVESTEEIEKLYKKISKYSKEKFIYLYTDLEGYNLPVYVIYDALAVLNKCSIFMEYNSAINKCCEKYPCLEDDIDELLVEDEPLENIDVFLRETVDDSLYNYMKPEYVPEETYIGAVLQDFTNEWRTILIKDLHENRFTYCKNFFIRDASQYEEYRKKLYLLMSNDLKDFLIRQDPVVEERFKHCLQQIYFF